MKVSNFYLEVLAVTELRKRMIECLQLRGLSERTQESYVRAVRQLSEHYHKSPELITEEELRRYFLFLKNIKLYSRNTMTIAICGIRFCYQQTLNRNWNIFGIVRPAPEKKLPVILSREETFQILALIRLSRYRVCLSTIYSCGLRLQEGIRLAVPDIDSARMMIHVRHGKGAKDRYVPLPNRNQRTIYNILFRASSEALQKLALDPKFLGARIGMVGVLHTWTRQLLYHPHVHYIVTGGGLSQKGSWRQSRQDFLVPVKPLSIIFRAKLRDHLKKTQLFAAIDPGVWTKAWVVHCEPVGSAVSAFKYLAPYIFRVAISNNRILKLEDGQVTFSYKDSDTDQLRSSQVTAEEFIRRFLQHVLPNRFIKVRYYGLLSPGNRHLLEKARSLLASRTTKAKAPIAKEPPQPPRCPHCGDQLTLLRILRPRGGFPP
jgi:site-specific recombinase XerC